MKSKQIINTSMKAILFVLGLLALLIISHEFYHLISINSIPTGVCFGYCEAQDNQHALAGVHWQDLPNNYDSKEGEIDAWIFSMLITLSFIILFFLTGDDIE